MPFSFGVASDAPVTEPFGSSGDLINMTVDLDNSTISFTVNDSTVRHSVLLSVCFYMILLLSSQFVAVSDLPPGEYYPVVAFYNEYEKAIDWIDLTGACLCSWLGFLLPALYFVSVSACALSEQSQPLRMSRLAPRRVPLLVNPPAHPGASAQPASQRFPQTSMQLRRPL